MHYPEWKPLTPHPATVETLDAIIIFESEADGGLDWPYESLYFYWHGSICRINKLVGTFDPRNQRNDWEIMDIPKDLT